MLDKLIDRALGGLIGVGRRRGRAEPVWVAVAAAAFLVRRARRQRDDVVWSGRVAPGERLLITTRGPGDEQ